MGVSFIGLGNMGAPMAANLLKGGVPLFVYNRTPNKADSLVKAGAKKLESPPAAFQKANVVITMLSNDLALEEITKELLQTIKPGCLHISMSTISPETSSKLEALHKEKGAFYLAAPVFGRPDAAAAGKLFIAMSGDPQARKQAEPFLKLMGQRVEDFGDKVSSANALKLAGNFMLASAIETMGEAAALGEANGIPREQLLKFFTETLFPSPVYQIYGKILAEQHFESPGFKLKLGLKDLSLVHQTAERSHVDMPVAFLLMKLLQEGIAQERGELDWAAMTLSAKDHVLIKPLK